MRDILKYLIFFDFQYVVNFWGVWRGGQMSSKMAEIFNSHFLWHFYTEKKVSAWNSKKVLFWHTLMYILFSPSISIIIVFSILIIGKALFFLHCISSWRDRILYSGGVCLRESGGILVLGNLGLWGFWSGRIFVWGDFRLGDIGLETIIVGTREAFLSTKSRN